MHDPPLFIDDIIDFLRNGFGVNRYPKQEQGGIYHPATRPVQRLGLALEFSPELPAWVVDSRLDALWLHRPWQCNPALLPPDVGVIYNHLPFNEHLTMGYNPRLAIQLRATGPLAPLGVKQAIGETGESLPPRPIGMLFDAKEKTVQDWTSQIRELFGGCDRAEAGRQVTAGRVAVVGAMNDALIREAADRGAGLYLTGQYRTSAQAAVDETGIAVIAVGHRRSEEWGLRALSNVLRERWPELVVLVGK